MADIPARLLKLSGMKADDIRSWAEVPERDELVIVDMKFKKHFIPTDAGRETGHESDHERTAT